MTTFWVEKKPSISQQFYAVPVENGNPPFESIAVPGLQQEFHLVYLCGSKKSTRWKSMVRTRLHLSLFWWIEESTRRKRNIVRTRLQLSLFGWIEKSTRWKRRMVRTRLHLSLFWWIEKSTRWKKKYGPNQTSTQPILVDRKIHTVEKKSMGRTQTSTQPILVDRKKTTHYKASGNITECEILV